MKGIYIFDTKAKKYNGIEVATLINKNIIRRDRMKYNFNEKIDRSENHAAKWAEMKMKFGREDLTPMWVADMDIKAAPEIVEAMAEKVKQEIFGYVYRPDSYYESGGR